MTRITIPTTLEDATASLGGLDRLLTAKAWERAAIVWAFTYEGRGGPRTVRNSGQLTARQFADLKVTGLRHVDTVLAYRRQWKRAMDEAGAPDVKPGQRVELPDLAWTWDGVSDDHGKRYVEKTEVAVGRSIARDELDVEVLAQNLSDEDAAVVVARLLEDRPDLATPAATTIMTDPDKAAKVLSDPVVKSGVIAAGNRVIADELKAKGATPTSPKPSSGGTSPGPLKKLIGALEVSQGISRVDIAMKNLANLVPNAGSDDRAAITTWLDNDHAQQCDELREQCIGLGEVTADDFA